MLLQGGIPPGPGDMRPVSWPGIQGYVSIVACISYCFGKPARKSAFRDSQTGKALTFVKVAAATCLVIACLLTIDAMSAHAGSLHERKRS